MAEAGPDDPIAWLEQARPHDGSTGYRMEGLWDESIWVLNPISVSEDVPLLLEPAQIPMLTRYASRWIGRPRI